MGGCGSGRRGGLLGWVGLGGVGEDVDEDVDGDGVDEDVGKRWIGIGCRVSGEQGLFSASEKLSS